MLLLGSKTITIDGITVFPDHADPSQFWYLPGPVGLARRPSDGRASFTYIKYKPAAVTSGAKGGGFLMFDCNLRLDRQLERRIVSKLSAISVGEPKLAVVPFDDGTVQCIALDLQGEGGTTNSAAPGTFRAVEKILGASVPSLHGDNSAAFSLTLSQEGAIILEEAFQKKTTPVGVIYNLKFTGMRPALDVVITADFERIYDHFSASAQAQVYFVQAGIEAGFEKLVQDGSIKIEVTNYTGGADMKQKEDWAKDFFKQQLLTKWFEPTLTLGQLAGGTAQPASLDEVLRRGNAMRPPATPAPVKPGTTPEQPVKTPERKPSPTLRQQGGKEEPNTLKPTPVDPGGSASGATSAQAADEKSPTEGTSPVQPTPLPPVASAGLAFNPAQSGTANQALSGGSGGTPVVASFKLKYIRQEEKKTLRFEYHSSEATQRTYAPQGFVGLLTQDIDLHRAEHFIEVDLDSPFFRVFQVSASVAKLDWTKIGLSAIHASLDYGDPSSPGDHKHKDFVFEADKASDQNWEVFMNSRYDTAYSVSLQYHFSPQSDWVGEKSSYEAKPFRTEDRTLVLNPAQHLGFLEVTVVPDRLDGNRVDYSEVELTYKGTNGWTTRKVIRVAPDSEPQFWRVRASDRSALRYTYKVVHYMKDGTTIAVDPVETDATKLPINDPFKGDINVEFFPLLDKDLVKAAFMELEYEDHPDTKLPKWEKRIQFNPAASGSQLVTISLWGPTSPRTFRYRQTIVTKDNKVNRGSWQETGESLVYVIG